jgi:hypothetical protein
MTLPPAPVRVYVERSWVAMRFVGQVGNLSYMLILCYRGALWRKVSTSE